MILRGLYFNGLLVVLFGVAAGSARADIVVRKDGGLLDGKVLSQNAKEVVFQADGADASAAQHLQRDGIARIVVTDEHGAMISDSSVPATQPATRWNMPPDPAAPPVQQAGKSPTYLVIPLHGEVGETVLASALEKSLEDAVKRKPTVVVLDIESPGGLVEESKQIIDVLHRYNKKLRIVAWTGQDLSAAAIFSLSVREIYVKPSSTIGAATSFIPGNMMLPPKIEEKMQSAWRAVARNSAEEGRHEPLLADAMIDSDSELHLETVDGKPVVKEGDGDHVLCRKGKILTLTSHEAVECGLAAGEADDLAELGTALKLPNWTETSGLGTLLADSIPKRTEVFKTQYEQIFARFQQDLSAAVTADPSDSVTTVRRVTTVGPQPARPMGPIGPGRHIVTRPGVHQETIMVTRHHPTAQWKSDSLACVVALQKVEADVRDASSLSSAFGRASEVAMLKEALDKLSAIRATIYDNRNKYGQGTVVANSTPAGSNTPIEPNPGAGVEPPRQPVTMPPGSKKTELVGGRGGGSYLSILREGKPAIGFRYSLGDWGGKPCIRQFVIVSTPRTAPLAAGFQEVVAKKDYVVGGLIVDADQTNVIAFRVIFIGYKDGRVDLKDTYQSDWQGTPDDNEPKTLAGKGEIVRGIFGRRGMNQDALGLVVSTPDDAGAFAPATQPAHPSARPEAAR